MVIEKNIAAIFSEINLLEYKSPVNYVSIDDFYKVYGYACLYAHLEKVPITKLTISFVQSHYPGKLLTHLKRIRGYIVEKTSPGIYTVKGDIIPIQVINNRQLTGDENLWLKSLSNKLDPISVIRISDEIIRQGKAVRIQAYMNAIAKANYHATEEAMNMSSPAKNLDEVLERTGFNARVEEKKAIKIAKKLVNLGLPFDTIVSATELDPEKVKNLYERKIVYPNG